MKRCAIITGGKYSLINHIERCDFVIACDKGYEYCLKQNIVPDLLIGDFDSFGGELPQSIETEVLPVEKDDTDTMHAYRYCVERGFDEIYLYCAFGNRLDHFLSNIQTAIFGAKNNITTYMSDEKNEFIVTDNKCIKLERKAGYSISLFAADKLTCVSIKGAKYELNEYDIDNSYPIGQSNEWTDDYITISKEDGVMIVVMSKLTD